MVNMSLVEAILHEQDDPGRSTTRQIRNIYNIRSGEDPIVQHTDEDKEFQSVLIEALEKLPVTDADDGEDKPISYTVKLKDSDENTTPTIQRRSIIKLPKEVKETSESEESSSDSEKPSIASSITLTKPFSPLFLNNMKKFGVSSDWLAKRSNSIRQSSYSRSSVKSNTSKLDAMIKSASAKPIRSNRKLSFVEPTTPTKIETDKENTDPLTDTNDAKDESKSVTSVPTPYDLSSDEIDEDEKDNASSPTSKDFSLRIPRVNLPDDENKRSSKRSSSSTSLASNEEFTSEKSKSKKKRRRRSKKETASTIIKKATTKRSSKKQTKDDQPPTTTNSTEEIKTSLQEDENDDQTTTTTSEPKKPSEKKAKDDQGQSRIEHLKKLLRISGIRLIMKKAELDELPSHKAKIKYLKALFTTAGYTGNLSIKDCQKFREKRDTEKELFEIQSTAVDVKGHIKGGRTLRGQGRTTDESDFNIGKRKRTASSELEDNKEETRDKLSDNDDDDDDDKPVVKKRRIFIMEASPEVSDNE